MSNTSTDTEITELCALAMGYKGESLSNHWGGLPMFASEIGPYNPLHDDAQAMALVKKLRLDLSHCDPFDPDISSWIVFSGHGDGIDATAENLNRAICECVAKMQQAKA